MSLWLMRSCPRWRSTDWLDWTKSSEANGSGSLWVSRGAAPRGAIETMDQMVQYRLLCVTSHPPGAIRDHLHLRPLWFCQLQFAWDCDWRPVWVFDHSFTMWCYYWRRATKVFSLPQSLHMPTQKRWHLIHGVESHDHWHVCVSCQCLHCR